MAITLNVLYAKKEKIYPVCVLKRNSSHKKQDIHLMISNREIRVARSERQQRHYLAVKRLSTLLRGLTSKNNADFYSLNCLHYFKTKNKV